VDSTVTGLAVVVRSALILLFLWMISGLLSPIVLGAVFAMLLHPVERRLAPKLRMRRRLSALIVTAATLILVLVPCVFIAIQLVASTEDLLSRDWTAAFGRLKDHINALADRYRDQLEVVGGVDRLRSVIQNFAQQIAQTAGRVAGRFAGSVPTVLLDLFLLVVSLYYFLLDGPRLLEWLAKLSPFGADETRDLWNSLRQTVQGAILGAIVTALVQGALTIVALSIFHVHPAFLLGVIAALLAAIVPMVGTTPVMLGAIGYLLLAGRPGAAIGMMVAAVVVGLSDNVVRPWVQSTETSIHPLLVLLGIFGGLEAFGPSGVFIGPLVAVTAVWAIQTYAAQRAIRAPA
jgi:predicted PurR-regulated permease PerM